MVDGFKLGQSAGLIPKDQAEGNDHRVIRNTAAATDIAAIRSRYFQALGFCGELFSRVIQILRRIYWDKSGKKDIGKTEPAKIADTHGKEQSREMITLMLNDSGVEPAHRPVDRLACSIQALVPDSFIAGHLAPQSGDRQATFPPQRLLFANGRDHRIDQDGFRNRLRLRIAFASFEPKNNYLKAHPNLRSRQPNSTRAAHSVKHILDQLAHRGIIDIIDWTGSLQKTGVPHAKQRSDSHVKELEFE